MSDQTYDFGPAFHYYDNVRTSNDILELHVASHLASRVAENISAALNDSAVSQNAGAVENIEFAPPLSDPGRDT